MTDFTVDPDTGQVVINETNLSSEEVNHLRDLGFEVANQGSERWHEERLGLATASRCYDVVNRVYQTKKNPEGRPGGSYYSYANELVAERISGKDKRFSSRFTSWGLNHEEAAATAYEEITGRQLAESEFVKVDGMAAGASPDRIVIDEPGLVEIKCPNTDTHISFIDFLENGDFYEPRTWSEYYAQMQFQMWVLDKQWCDFVSHDPAIEEGPTTYIKRVDLDEYFIEDMVDRLTEFLGYVDKKEKRVREYIYG